MRKLTVLLLLSTGIVFILTIPCYSQQTSIFTVFGEVFLSDGVTHAPDGNIVTVKNLNTGISLSTTVGATEPGKYTVVFADFTGNRAAAVGDVIQTTVNSPEGELLASPAPHTVTAADITAKRVRIDIIFPKVGDVSGDGRITAFDASLVLQYVVGLIELSQEQKNNADVTGNGTITAMDAALILQYTVGLITQFPVQLGAPKAASTSTLSKQATSLLPAR